MSNMTFNAGELNKLPVLVCKNFVAYPTITTMLYAEREFSKNSLKNSVDNFESYIVVLTQNNAEQNTNFVTEDVSKFGTLCRIANYTGEDTTRIRLLGIDRIQLMNLIFDDQKNEYFAEFVTVPDILGEEKKEVILVKNLLCELENSRLTILTANQSGVISKQLSNGMSALNLSYYLSNVFPFSIDKKIKLLEAKDVNDRLEQLLIDIDALKKDFEIEAEIQDEIRKSTDKNQREYILREKLNYIRKELGDDPSSSDSQDAIMKKLDENPYPEYVKDKIKDEIKRFNMMPQASLEASLIKNYIDIMISLPWFEKTEDNDDLSKVREILDEDHYGLEKVKERILEYLAVKKMTGNLKAPILCFYGPPGVGKTSLGKSIARALGRKFVKSSLGGLSDESEIRGHRRTYVGSMPGRIIQGMRKAKTSNPVFLLDEIDKIGSSYKGDPASALLEVLDPEQNFAFNDNYVEEPFDLSNVLFICTANYLGNIPEPLRDRLELIEVNSYTIIEKLHIAKEHLIKKELEATGLTSEQINFTDEAINYIIERYTMEAGVRELERKIGSIMRKVAVEIIENKHRKTVTIDESKVKKYLGIELFESPTKEKGKQVGVVTGLAYTEFGGDILPIEVNNFPGKGELILTGKLGDVMKESCSIAFDYIKANAKKYGIDDKVFTENSFHIHFPEGAVPKDGPSAGCAITTAIVSCLTNTPVSGDIAMTGEVTLRGKAIPIGGLREKTLAALRSGIKTVIIPKENKKNVNELPEEVKNNLKIIYMDNVSEAIKICLEK